MIGVIVAKGTSKTAHDHDDEVQTMRPSEQKSIDRFLLDGSVTLAEARGMRLPPAPVLRDLRDSLLIQLCAYPLGEAGPRSSLAELQAFGLAFDRDRSSWKDELTDDVGVHMLKVVDGITRENREQRRWDLLIRLGAPSTEDWDVAINVFTRVIASRVVDGFLHPVLGAQSVTGISLRPDATAEEATGVTIVRSSTDLLRAWHDNPRDQRAPIVEAMAKVFRSGLWT